MTERPELTPDFSSIRGELRFLKFIVFIMIVFAALHYISFFRLIGVTGIPPLLLVLYRILDIITIMAFLFFCGTRVKLVFIEFLLLIFAFYPCLIGLVKGNISLTFGNDISIYLFFVIKIVLFHTILRRIQNVISLDKIFKDSAYKLTLWCAAIAFLTLGTATLMLWRGVSFYYQAPAELTFAAALVLAQGKIFGYAIFVILALMAGKRMIMAGLLFMGLIALLGNRRVRFAAIRLVLAAVLIVTLAFVFQNQISTSELAFVDKIEGTFQQIMHAMKSSENNLEILMLIDPVRYAEYYSLKPHLTGASLWFGNGYGFRYELDAELLSRFGYSIEGDVTNAHFTPLAIVSKFGLVGLFIWIAVTTTVLVARSDRSSYLQYACKLAFISMLLQSIFAFSFFINYFTSFYIAVLILYHGTKARIKKH